MDDNWIKASVIQRTLNAFQETQWTVIGFLFVLLLKNDNFNKDRVQQIAVINVIDDRIMRPYSDKPRFQRNFWWSSSIITYSLVKNLKPSHSNLKKPIIIKINFMESRFTTEAIYLLTCQKGIYFNTRIPKDKLASVCWRCKQKPKRWELVWWLWWASGCCNLPVFYRWFWAGLPSCLLILIFYKSKAYYLH